VAGASLEGEWNVPTDLRDLSCQQLVELLTEYLEAALPAELRAACEGHLAGCGPCATYLAQMRQTVALLGELIDETVDLTSRERLIARLKAGPSEGA
jgi:anti-sigma factor RsiW